MTSLLEGITATPVATDRYRANVLDNGKDGAAIVLIHGNVSSSLFWQPLMLELDRRALAIDLRGFGASEIRPVDATRGLRDFSDDIAAVLDALGVADATIVGWSMGAGVALQVLIDRPDLVGALVLESPVSPYGFGGTRLDGSLTSADAAGTGGGGANPAFVELLAAKDTAAEGETSPRGVFRAAYVAPGYASEHEDLWVASMCSTATGEDNYPGTATASANWPGFAPGERGVLNSLAPTVCRLDAFADAPHRPPIAWVRGTADAIVSDTSSFDLNLLGQIGVIPGWPGEQVAPPQPMVAQTRAVLERYRANGGSYAEYAWEGVGHSPHLERPTEFARIVRNVGS